MNRSAIFIVIGMLSLGTAAAQSEKDLQGNPQTPASASSAPSPQANASLPNGSSIDAALTKSIDTKKAKKGDPVSARVVEDAKEQDGKTVIPKGSKLEGHITQASSREKGDSFSTLGIVFDKAILKDGQEVRLNVQVQALAISQDAASAPAAGPAMDGGGGTAAGGARSGGGGGTAAGGARSGSGGGTAAGGARSGSGGGASGGMSSATTAPPMTPNTNMAANTDTNNAAAGTGAVGGLNSSGRLNPGSRGVFGLQGIGLATAAEGTQQAAVVTSTDKNVHLDSGTQLLLVTQGSKS
jgi:hypothetical protein